MPPVRSIQRVTDFLITLLLWLYFMFGFLILFFFFYLPTHLFSATKAPALQQLIHNHMKYFFKLTKRLIPRTEFLIQEDVPKIHSSIIVCNHLSYLDPILLVSLMPKQRTIVKSTFFNVPIFGWFLKNAGYIPSSPIEMQGPAMIKNLEEIKEHLAAGGNLFVFPEGTRSRDGKLNPFNKGVFSIARYCNAPLKLILLMDTDKLFQPGSFSFKTHDFNRIKVELIGSLYPDYKSKDFSINAVANQARSLFEEALNRK